MGTGDVLGSRKGGEADWLSDWPVIGGFQYAMKFVSA